MKAALNESLWERLAGTEQYGVEALRGDGKERIRAFAQSHIPGEGWIYSPEYISCPKADPDFSGRSILMQDDRDRLVRDAAIIRAHMKENERSPQDMLGVAYSLYHQMSARRAEYDQNEAQRLAQQKADEEDSKFITSLLRGIRLVQSGRCGTDEDRLMLAKLFVQFDNDSGLFR
jgi:hypothetical protein